MNKKEDLLAQAEQLFKKLEEVTRRATGHSLESEDEEEDEIREEKNEVRSEHSNHGIQGEQFADEVESVPDAKQYLGEKIDQDAYLMNQTIIANGLKGEIRRCTTGT